MPVVALGTAHPAKFPAAVEAASGIASGPAGRISRIFDRPERFTVLPNEQRRIEAFVRERSRAAAGAAA